MNDLGLTKRIDNYSTIMEEIDKALGVEKPPAIEYLYVLPFPKWKLFGLGFGSPYGHSAVRFTLPSGKQIVMNIVKNSQGKKMVNFIEPNEYLFGIDSFENGGEQGGIYNRTIVSVRIENYPEDKIRDLEYFFNRLKRLEEDKQVSFNLAIGPIANFIKNRIPMELAWAEQGNCARWTSAGLEFAGLMSYKCMWPKTVWIHLFENFGKKDSSNVNVVVYKRADHATHLYGENEPKMVWESGVTAPLSPLWNWSYLNLNNFANVVVKIPKGTTKAEVKRIDHSTGPSYWRYRRSEILFGSVLTSYGLYRSFKLLKVFKS